jgi:hypothetical protein
MKDEIFKIIGAVVIIGFIVFLAAKTLKLHFKVVEGLSLNDATSSTSAVSTSGGGEAASAESYSSTLKNKVTQLQDTLLVSKYRKEYENIILNMDDYVSILMLRTTLSMDPNADDATSNLEKIKALNELNNSKSALNNVMKYVDSH